MGKPITTSEISQGGEAATWFRVPRKPILTVIRWQAVTTVLLSGLAAFAFGFHWALSTALGGLVSICGAFVFLVIASRAHPRSPEAGLYVALKAQAAKIGSMLALLLAILFIYKSVVVLALIATFLITVIIFSLALFVRGA